MQIIHSIGVGVNYFRDRIYPNSKKNEEKESVDLEVGKSTLEESSTQKEGVSFAKLNPYANLVSKDSPGFFIEKGEKRARKRQMQREKIKNPSANVVGSSAYAIAAKHDTCLEKLSIVDMDTLKDIGILGVNSIPIGKRHTVMGEVVMRGVLSRPISELEILRKRQFVIQSLLDTPLLTNDLNSYLAKMQEGENQLLTFWNEDTTLPRNLDSAYYKIGGCVGEVLNYSSWSLGGSVATNRIGTLGRLLHSGTSAVVCSLYGVSKLVEEFSGPASSSLAEVITNTNATSVILPQDSPCASNIPIEDGQNSIQLSKYQLALPSLSMENYVRSFGNIGGGGGGRGNKMNNLMFSLLLFMPGNLAPAVSSLALGYFSSLRFQMQFGELANDLSLESEIQKKLVSVSSYYRNMKSTYEVLAKYPEITEGLEHFNKLKSFMNDPEMKPLFSVLGADTFSSKADYFFSRGNVLLAWRLLSENEKVREGFEAGLLAIGEVDSYLSLVSEFESSNEIGQPKLCFSEYILDKDYPELEIKDVWHPLVKKDQVVTNSISFGVKGFARNGVFTGPNGSGKSTILRSIAFNVALSLSYGVGCASSIRLPLFHYVKSSMNPSDSLEKGISLFQAQSDLVGTIGNELNKMPKDKFAFLILDELFTGTNPEEGAALAQAAVEDFFSKRNLMGIVVTHHDSVTQLKLPSEEEILTFKNYRFAFTGNGEPTHKLEEGVSTVKEAINTASKRGVSGAITKRAQEIVEEGRSGKSRNGRVVKEQS